MNIKGKILVGIIGLSLILVPVQKAEAILGVGDIVFESNPALISNAVGETFFRTVTKIAVNALKRRLLSMVTDQIINWIEGGGKPMFVTDWKRFVSDAANFAVGDFAIELGLEQLCSPFGLQVQLTILNPPRFTDYVSCTLDDIVDNIENFYEDFRNGGWFAYSEMWMPQNNYYGAVMLAMNEKNNRIAKEMEASVFEAIAGDGFLGTRKCDPSGRFCTITTPGSQVGALLAKAVGSDIDYLVNADDLAVYLGAIADALINKLVRSGADGLISLTTPDKPQNGYFSGSGPCTGLRGSDLTNCLSLIQANERTFEENQRTFITQIDATLLPRQAGGEVLATLVENQSVLVRSIANLRDCQIDRNLPEAISTETNLRNEQTALNQLNGEFLANKQITEALESAKFSIQNPSYPDTPTIAYYYNNIVSLLDEEAAQSFQTAKDAIKEQMQNEITGKISIAQQQLEACR
jgi:hypothetical protein